VSKQGFYYDNMFRTYPFVDPDVGIQLPKSTIVDFNCYIYSEVGFREDENVVWLYRVSRTGDDFTFSFACDAEGLDGQLLEFTKNLNDPELSYQFSGQDISYNSSYVPPEENTSDVPTSCPEAILWEGYLVIGNLTELADIISSGEVIYDFSQGTVVEPALVVNIQDSTIRTINIANKLPVQVTPPEGCGEAVTPARDILVYRSCLTGDIKFTHGYSCNVGMTVANNQIDFTATVDGSIKGQFCGNESELPIYLKSELIPGMQVAPNQAIPEGSVLYTGGPTCRDTLKSINGINAKGLWIVGGKGISLTADQETFSINVEITLSGLAICANPSLSLSSVSLGG
jgi:hypothetical protein